ncbi:sel1 repeat family protein [Campylobacter sp. JMF_06 NA1]|uniref:tetratricopeptide repeat protein n=1 Tax=Campylobacter sp. JMF_06 NA1 TaxID=2983823 RepID=UPI0022E9D77E|nr:tetratricopeptide repeat protein [Campylobacter sp. JMF_06 NA1]MDA3077329.1 sel1 repeat family protein [Campylobacter sp. JMF_06 NA1]
MKKFIYLFVIVFFFFLSYEKQRIIFCYLGDTASCHNVGYCNEIGDNNTKINLEKAKKYYEKACQKDFMPSCNNLGLIMQNENKITQAREYFEKTCDLGEVRACNSLRASYFQNEPKEIYKSAKISAHTCDKFNEPTGCLFAGLLYIGADDVLEKDKVDLKKGAYYLGKGCDLDQNESCYQLGDFYRTNKELEKSNKYFKKGCDLNHTISCAALIVNYSIEKPRDNEKITKYAEKICELNESFVCYLSGMIYMGLDKTIKIPIDTAKGKNYLKKGCAGENNESCYYLGRIYAYDEKNYEKGNKYYKKACDLNNSNACNSIGFHYENGFGFEINLKEAYKYYKKACENLKNNYGCGSLGYLYLVGNMAGDVINSPEFYEKSCKFNDGENCANLENFLKNYDFIDRDYNKAKELLEYSCDEKVPQSCGVLGTMYEFGKGASQDIFVAKENYKKACDLGYKLGCDELKRLEND